MSLDDDFHSFQVPIRTQVFVNVNVPVYEGTRAFQLRKGKSKIEQSPKNKQNQAQITVIKTNVLRDDQRAIHKILK